MIDTAVIIVNWNGEKLLPDCLLSLSKQTYSKFKVFIVDNNSSDNSIRFIEDKYSQFELIKLSKNYGFAKGNNIAIRKVLKNKEIKFIVFLNTDTIVDKNWLHELVKTARKYPSCGMVASKAYFKGKKTLECCGLSLEKSLTNSFQGDLGLGSYLDSNSKIYSKELKILCPGGMSALYKTDVLKKIGLFDEDFFMYAEDLDLGMRAQLYGFDCYFNPNSKLVHLKSKSSNKKNSNFKVIYNKRNLILFAVKNFPLTYLLQLPYLFIKDHIKNYKTEKINYISQFKDENSLIKTFYLSLLILFKVIFLLPKTLNKRRIIQKNKIISTKNHKMLFKLYNRTQIEKNS